jgi:RHS repeat-associated protein
MRRCFAGALLIVLLAQSSGVAVAETSSRPSSGFDLGAAIASVQSAITSSLLFAVVTGTQDRYAAMHAPPPAPVRPHNGLSAAALMRKEHALLPRPRMGSRESLRLPPRSELTSRKKVLDPRAMRPSTLGSPRLSPADVNATGSQSMVAPAAAAMSPSRAKNAFVPRRQGIKNNQISSGPGTGIEHWWTYEEHSVPGIGKAMVNVGTGNYMVSAVDVDVPEQGINLAFQRMYNSQSLHDVNGDDGGDPAIFGNRWTNTFDANIVYKPNNPPQLPPTITIYDIDGTACTYTSNGSGSWIPCTGEYATLAPVLNNNCEYTWTRKNGTVYLFQSDGGSLGFCGSSQNLKGHLVEILSRNSNNYITFTYSYDSSGQKTSEHVTEIDVQHSDGQQLVLTFGIVPGTSYNELQSIQRPDTATLQYLYDNHGNLVEVDKPGNNSAFPAPSPPPGHPATPPPGDVPETYGYTSTTGTLGEACGPRCTVSFWNNAMTFATDGSALMFDANASQQLSYWEVQGVLNFTPSDGTSTPLQSGSTGWNPFYTANFYYGAQSTCGSGDASATAECDSDGHSTIWETNLAGSVTSTTGYTGNPENVWFATSTEGWDTNNNLVSTADANGNMTQYAYDTAGYNQGNMVEMMLPSMNDVSGGVSPLTYYSYDQFNNVKAYCDPVYNQTNGNPWKPSPGDNLCPSGPGAALFQYNTSDPNEPYGCLVGITKPGGYPTTINYPGSPGPCAYGLPKSTVGQTIQQYGNFSSRTPTQDFTYDPSGNLATYDKGVVNQQALDSWTLYYDKDNLNNKRTENDSVINPQGITSYTCYYPDGSVFYTESASQHHFDAGGDCPTTSQLLSGPRVPPTYATAYYYDVDGDQVQVIESKGCIQTNCGKDPTDSCTVPQTSTPIGTTCKYYDGLDRLVETAEPWDNRKFGGQGSAGYEFYNFRWMNRYIYDLSQQGDRAQLEIGDATGNTASFAAYGNLYKTQECVPTATTTAHMLGEYSDYGLQGPFGPYSGCTWSDLRGSSFDAFNRTVNKYELAYGAQPVTQNTYDQPGQLDLLSETENAVGQTTQYGYDEAARVESLTFGGPQPRADSRTYQFDADGRTTAQHGTLFGEIDYTYDVDGNKLSVKEPPASSGYTGGSLICYQYYPDGLREYLSVGDPSKDTCQNITNQSSPGNGGIRQGNLFSYAYQEDGLLVNQLLTWGSMAWGPNNPPQNSTFNWSYYASGREQTETDPVNNTPVAFPPNYTTSGYTSIGVKSYSYDQYGRVSQLTFPEGFTEYGFSYDYDDELASYGEAQTPSQENSGLSRYLTVNSRGEVLEDSPVQNTGPGSGTTWTQGQTYSANGVQVGDGNSGGAAKVQAPPTTLQFDVRSNMVRCSTVPDWISQTQPGVAVYTYDAAGRQTGIGRDTSNACNSQSATAAATYDAEDHVQTFNSPFTGVTGNGTAEWGPDGKQRIDDAGQQPSMTAHWDEDTLLFATQSGSPSYTVVYVGKFAAVQSTGDLLVSDRDQSGAQVASHGYTTMSPWWGSSNYWYSDWTTATVRKNVVTSRAPVPEIQIFPGSCNLYFNGQQYNCPAFTQVFPMKRSDGYSMVGGIVQGARTYDPTSGQWLTPDPYAGDVRDPMSQKPFMWNNNNPVEWQDPTGYETACVSLNQPCISAGAADSIGNGVITLYKLAIGSDIDTLRDPRAGLGAKALAAVLIGTNFIAPEKLIGEAAARIGIRSLEYSGKVIAQAAHDTDFFHNFTQQVDAEVFSAGNVTQKGNYVEFSATGAVQDKNGIWHDGQFEIGGTLDSQGHLTVRHRFFKETPPR